MSAVGAMKLEARRCLAAYRTTKDHGALLRAIQFTRVALGLLVAFPSLRRINIPLRSTS